MKKIIIVLVIVILAIGGFVAYKVKSATTSENAEATPTPSIALPTISGNVSVELTPKSDNKAMVLKITGIPGDIVSIEYELTYMTGAGLPRGVLGKIQVNGESSITRDDIVLGTCSSGKCVYDTGVKSVDLSLKFNSSGGTSSVFQKTYTF